MAKNRSVRSTLTSRSQFITDLIPEGALHTKIVRASESLARFSIVSSPELSGTAGIILAADIPGKNYLEFFGDKLPLLAEDRVVYRGQPIGLVYATSSEEVDRILAGISIEYEPVDTPVFEPSEETLYHAEELNWEAEEDAPEELPEILDSDDEVDTLPDMPDDTDYIVQEISSEFQLASQFQAVQEPLTAIARWEESVLQVLTPAVWPHHLERSLQQALGLRAGAVEVRCTIPGMYHDRLLVDTAVLGVFAGLVAKRARQAAVVALDHEEELRFATRQAPIRCRHSIQVHPAFGLMSVDAVFQVNMGAYPSFSKEVCRQMLGSANLAYRSAKGKIRVEIHRTNLLPMSVFHGFLSGQAQTCMEIQINRTAHLLNMDPLELRMGILGEPDQDLRIWGPPPRCITLLPSINVDSDFSRKFSSYEVLRKRREDRSVPRSADGFQSLRGIGASLGFQGNGFSRETEQALKSRIHLQMEQNGTVRLLGSMTPGSSAIKSHFRDYLMEQLSLKDEQIELSPLHTSSVPDGGPMSLSRSLTITNRLLSQAAATIQKRRFRDPLPISVSKAFQIPRGKKSGFGYPWLPTSWGAAVVEVKVDPVSYLPAVSGIWLTIQAGDILHPAQARGHIEGTVIQSLSWVLNQRWELVDGVLVPRLAAGGGPSGLLRTPSIKIDFLDDDGIPLPERRADRRETTLPRGIGELAQAIIPPALLSALSQATGQYFDQIPITPELIHKYMEAE